MRQQVFTPQDLEEAKANFSSALVSLRSGEETDTEKGSRFDVTLNRLLLVAFVYEASQENATLVPLNRPDLSEFLEQGLGQLEDCKRRYGRSDIESRRIDKDLYAVSILTGDSLDLNKIEYKKESRILDNAYNRSKALVQGILDEVFGLQDHSDLGTKVERIVNKKTYKGSGFLAQYLNILDPKSTKPLSSYPTFGQLVQQRQVDLQRNEDVRLEQEQSLKDLGPVLGPLWNLMRANIR
jgi:hypothetical protein